MSQNAISAYLNAKADATANTAVANSVNTLSGTVTAHTADTTIHVTSNDKTNWDGKLNKSDFDTYSGATSTAIGGKLATSDFNTYSGSTDTFIKTKADSSALTEHTSNAAIHVTTDNKTNWDAAYTDKHIHENKTTLDAITSEKVTNWDTAFNKAHDHSNMSVLSAITSTDVAAWNEVSAKTNNVAYTAYTAATDTVLGNKVDKAEGMALSHNDFSDAYKNKLDAIAESAQVNTIESISIAGTAATIANKTVNLGAAAGRGVASTIASAGEDLVPSGLFYTSAGTKVVYDSNEKKIYLKNAGNTIISEIDASAFIKDGMVSNVEIKTISSGGTNVSCLVVTFNTDAEKQDINIPIDDIFDADMDVNCIVDQFIIVSLRNLSRINCDQNICYIILYNIVRKAFPNNRDTIIFFIFIIIREMQTFYIKNVKIAGRNIRQDILDIFKLRDDKKWYRLDLVYL